MQATIPGGRVVGWVRLAVSVVLLALLVAIGAMQTTIPVAAQRNITQAPTIPGSRNLTQAPSVGSVYPVVILPRTDPRNFPASPDDAPDPLYLPTSPRPAFSQDRPDPLYIPTTPR